MTRAVIVGFVRLIMRHILNIIDNEIQTAYGMSLAHFCVMSTIIIVTIKLITIYIGG